MDVVIDLLGMTICQPRKPLHFHSLIFWLDGPLDMARRYLRGLLPRTENIETVPAPKRGHWCSLT